MEDTQNHPPADKRESDKEQNPSTGKLPYQAPQLERHGDIETLTRNIGLVGADGLTGSRLM